MRRQHNVPTRQKRRAARLVTSSIVDRPRHVHNSTRLRCQCNETFQDNGIGEPTGLQTSLTVDCSGRGHSRLRLRRDGSDVSTHQKRRDAGPQMSTTVDCPGRLHSRSHPRRDDGQHPDIAARTSAVTHRRHLPLNKRRAPSPHTSSVGDCPGQGDSMCPLLHDGRALKRNITNYTPVHLLRSGALSLK